MYDDDINQSDSSESDSSDKDFILPIAKRKRGKTKTKTKTNRGDQLTWAEAAQIVCDIEIYYPKCYFLYRINLLSNKPSFFFSLGFETF